MNKIDLYGADWCPECRKAKGFLDDNSFNCQFIDVDHQTLLNYYPLIIKTH